ncbi:unnamed protein product [Protopolystoma xenopodis]|uniref:Uncharacterized protein n=1 Tax=Protopolystoma xenopodis TaxID=117903 RepID=A0A448XJL8_9PLAT|nr:unnamed protein product [Protopolystoma xenopodis]
MNMCVSVQVRLFLLLDPHPRLASDALRFLGLSVQVRIEWPPTVEHLMNGDQMTHWHKCTMTPTPIGLRTSLYSSIPKSSDCVSASASLPACRYCLSVCSSGLRDERVGKGRKCRMSTGPREHWARKIAEDQFPSSYTSVAIEEALLAIGPSSHDICTSALSLHHYLSSFTFERLERAAQLTSYNLQSLSLSIPSGVHLTDLLDAGRLSSFELLAGPVAPLAVTAVGLGAGSGVELSREAPRGRKKHQQQQHQHQQQAPVATEAQLQFQQSQQQQQQQLEQLQNHLHQHLPHHSIQPQQTQQQQQLQSILLPQHSGLQVPEEVGVYSAEALRSVQSTNLAFDLASIAAAASMRQLEPHLHQTDDAELTRQQLNRRGRSQEAKASRKQTQQQQQQHQEREQLLLLQRAPHHQQYQHLIYGQPLSDQQQQQQQQQAQQVRDNASNIRAVFM